jgi:hypothetical protein
MNILMGRSVGRGSVLAPSRITPPILSGSGVNGEPGSSVQSNLRLGPNACLACYDHRRGSPGGSIATSMAISVFA